MLPSFGNYEQSHYKHSHAGFYVDVNFSAHLGKYLGLQLLGCMITLCLALWETAEVSSKEAVPFCIPSSNDENSCCCISLPAFGVVSVLDFSHSNRCVVVSYFNLQLPNDIWYWSCFRMLICHLYVFLQMCLFRSFAHL